MQTTPSFWSSEWEMLMSRSVGSVLANSAASLKSASQDEKLLRKSLYWTRNMGSPFDPPDVRRAHLVVTYRRPVVTSGFRQNHCGGPTPWSTSRRFSRR